MAINQPYLNVRNSKYFKALSSAQRLEIISSLGDAGAATIAELSERLGRSPHSLYHHMKKLMEAGIVYAVREGKRKKEAVYRLTSQKILLATDRKSRAAIRAAKRSLDSVLHLTSREVYDALQSNTKREGLDREFFAIRLKGRFLPKTLRLLNRHLNRIEKIFHKQGQSPEGNFYALTLVLTPCRIKP